MTTSSPESGDNRFLSTRTLFTQFIQLLPGYERLQTSVDYVLRICNAAIHGQVVPDGHAQANLTHQSVIKATKLELVGAMVI